MLGGSLYQIRLLRMMPLLLPWNNILGIAIPYSVQLVVPSCTQYENPTRVASAELFQDHFVVSARENVTSLKLQKCEDNGDWFVEKTNKPRYQGNGFVVLDPFARELICIIQYIVMIKKAPKKDARREYCNLSFTNADIVFIKANGKRVHLSKNGKKKNFMYPIFICTTHSVV